ncbi:DUF3696 domain-containing protein [Halomonas sp. MCCC 1A11062]|uniref:DUF3696 domain-containing protein n=1 Tax=Halomonas sp. MCCC 1A11062 TaxID=2733485 RepID=UPI001F458D3A|nr:DUF3696 domain-containing protein [Halomonas sp. MCCC 1A11062]MCE8037033.1 DUF3696 domain-containing protein [Halomonas sp. MCCC 1A11062]
MLTELRLQNFKAWRDTGPMRLAPLTVIFGTNSSGKSSLGHLLLALKQTAMLADHKRSLHLGDNNSLIDLGTYEDCVYGRDVSLPIEFGLRWKLNRSLTVKNILNGSQSYQGRELALHAEIAPSNKMQPETRRFDYSLCKGREETLRVSHGRDGSKAWLECEPLKLVRAQGRGWPVEPPEKFYRFSDRTLSRYQNADFLALFALQTEELLEKFYHLGPLRSHPKRVYSWSGDTPSDVGAQGELMIPAILAASEQGRKLNRGPGKKKQRFDAFIASWLAELGIIHKFDVQPIAPGRKEYEVLIQTHVGTPWVKLTDVGFGISQVLPALVQAFYTPPESVLWMEQPEIHLHPRVQANLADAFISAIKARENGEDRNVQLIIESHSEHFLNRLQRRVAEGDITTKDIAVYFVNRDRKGAHLEPLKLNEYGDIENWPDDFFGDDMEDITQRALAAARKRKAKKAQEASA